MNTYSHATFHSKHTYTQWDSWKVTSEHISASDWLFSVCTYESTNLRSFLGVFHKRYRLTFSFVELLSFCLHLKEIRHKLQKFYNMEQNMPNNLSSNIQLDIMAIAMNETIIKPDPPLLDFQIAEPSVNSNTPYKYHFR